MTTTDATTVRLTGRQGLLAAVPALLGFHPQESLVMICLSGPRRRVGPILRVDLDEPATDASTVLHLVGHARRYADEVALVCFTEHGTVPPVLEQLGSSLLARGCRVVDMALVRGGRAYSVGDDRDETWDRGGGAALPDDDDPQVARLTAATVLSGRSILPDRASLRASIAGPTRQDAARAWAAMHAAADELLGIVGRTGPVDRERLRQVTGATVERALSQTAGPGGVDVPTSALLALLVCDVQVRDGVIRDAVADLESPWIPMLISVARSVPDEAQLRSAQCSRSLPTVEAKGLWRRWRSIDPWQQSRSTVSPG